MKTYQVETLEHKLGFLLCLAVKETSILCLYKCIVFSCESGSYQHIFKFDLDFTSIYILHYRDLDFSIFLFLVKRLSIHL